MWLAWQTLLLGQREVADELFSRLGTDVPDSQRIAVTMASIEYYAQSGNAARADTLLQPLLEDEKLAGNAGLWRLGCVLSYSRGKMASAANCLEKAMQIEGDLFPDAVDLRKIRVDYGQLLALYGRLAETIAAPNEAFPPELLRKIVRSADRWRALDNDKTPACQAAARTLRNLGATELSWDYLSSPLALNPNETAPWLSLAQSCREQGDFEMADRAYALAAESDSANAQILYDRAKNLTQWGKREEANKLFKKIVDGKWQPRFKGI